MITSQKKYPLPHFSCGSGRTGQPRRLRSLRRPPMPTPITGRSTKKVRNGFSITMELIEPIQVAKPVIILVIALMMVARDAPSTINTPFKIKIYGRIKSNGRDSQRLPYPEAPRLARFRENQPGYREGRKRNQA